jgi:hypothetical protein
MTRSRLSAGMVRGFYMWINRLRVRNARNCSASLPNVNLRMDMISIGIQYWGEAGPESVIALLGYGMDHIDILAPE